MLQWMGGSRRKVTTSRKSTQKRQQQYFEQRKRQQQKQTVGFEGYADETGIGGQHQKEYRSLDILNLLNLSTVSEEDKSCPSRSDGKIGALKMMYHIPKDPPTIITNSFSPPYSVEIKEAGGSPSSDRVELKYPNYDNPALNGMNNSQDLWNAGTEKQLSVFDMLVDEASEGSLERSLVHETHVAFSIEGLGKIRAETPLHSPKQQGRSRWDDCSLPWNVARQLNSSRSSKNDLELEVDAMMQEINMPLDGSTSEFSMGVRDINGNWRPDCSTLTGHMHIDNDYSNRKCSFGETNIFYNIRREDTIDDEPTFLDDDSLNERKDDISWKHWPYEIDGDFGDYEKGAMSDNAFEDHHMWKKRHVKATKLNSLDSPSPKYAASEVARKYTNLIGVRHTPVRTNYGIGDLPGQPDWPYFGTEDAEDNLSSLSEESSSSSAVMGGTINSSPPNLMARQSRRISNPFGRSRKKYDVDGLFANFGQQPSKCTRKPAQAWLLDEGCNSVDTDLGFSSFHCTSEAKLPSSGSKLWSEDPFHVPELNSCFDRPMQGGSMQCSPFGCFTRDKFAFRQPVTHTAASDDSPVLSKVGSDSVERDLCPEPHRETEELPDLSVQGIILGDDKREWKCQLEKENCAGNDLLFSDDAMATSGSNPEIKDLECKETKDGTPKSTTTDSPDHVEETSSSVKVHDKSESSINEKGV